jgi:hypothetical protein
MKLNIKELLDLFDDRMGSKKGDANALVTMLGEELNASVYEYFRNSKVQIIPNLTPTPGTRKGKRLDRWIVDKEHKILYQCEIKNWTASAIGGKQLISSGSDKEVKEIANYHWNRELNGNLSKNPPKKDKHPNRVSKVLLKMKAPKEHGGLTKEPLLIYWMPISLDKKGFKPLSTLPVEHLYLQMNPEFSKLYIFSVSLYLRQLYKNGKGIKFIDLDMPHLERRIKILDKLQIKK